MTEPASAASRADDRSDQVTLLRAVAIVAIGYGIGASLQSAYIYSAFVPGWDQVSVWQRLFANVAAVATLVFLLWVLRLHRERALGWIVFGAVGASGLTSAARYGAQLLIGVYTHPTRDDVEAELVSGFTIAAISTAIGLWSVHSRRIARGRTRAAERAAVHVEVAVRALEQEEVRVRRAVAEGLHGTLQQKLVLVDARLASVLAHASLSPGDLADLEWVRAELDEAREIDVREMSRLLYPDRLELGLVPAVRALLGRIPASIATRLVVSPQVRRVDDPASGSLTTAQRLLAARVVEEGVTNALKHGPAATIAVSLDVADDVLVVTVENDGDLYDPDAAGAASGTARLGHRLSLVGGTLTLTSGGERGARLEARIPLADD